MGIVQAIRGFAYSFLTNARLSIFECIAIDGSSRISIGTSCSTVYFTFASFREMKSGNTGCDDACTLLADAGRSEVCHVTVQALRAAVGIRVDTGIIIEAFVVLAGADDALAILAISIVRAFCIAFAAMQ